MKHKSLFYTLAKASAGTGKTYSLVENYLCSIFGLNPSLKKNRPSEVLAITFTKKAALEMRLRIASALNDFLKGDYSNCLISDLFSKFNQSPPKKEEIKNILIQIPNAKIATFHSFFASVLKDNAQTLGLSHDFILLSPHSEMELARNVLRPLIMENIADKRVRSLIARFHLGSGSINFGLLDSFIEFHNQMAEKNISIDNLKKNHFLMAIKESDCLEALKTLKVELANFKKYGATTPVSLEKICKIEEAFKNFEKNFELKNEQKCAFYLNPLIKLSKGNFGDGNYRRTLVDSIHNFSAILNDYFLYDEEEKCIEIIGKFSKRFIEIKLSKSIMSYNDILQNSREMLINNKEIRKKIQTQYRHILIDEYQDISPIQEDLIALLIEGEKNKDLEKNRPLLDQIDNTCGPSLFAVGDKKQSIYSFRGSDPKLFDRMYQKMSIENDSHSFDTKLLSVNFRSYPKLLNFINLVSKCTLIDQGYVEDEALKSVNEHKNGQAEIWVISPFEEKSPLEQNLFGAANKICELLNKRKDLKPKDIVVLVRRIQSAEMIKDIFSLHNISAVVVNGDGFYLEQEIIDLIAVLKLAIDKKNGLSAAIVLRSNMILMKDQYILYSAINNENKLEWSSIFELAKNNHFDEDTNKRILAMDEVLENIRKNMWEKGLLWALNLIIEKFLVAYSIGFSNKAKQKWANINKLRNMLLFSKDNPIAVIEELWNNVYEEKKEPLAAILNDDSENKINIMSIHQSKGLEFKVVVLADTESHIPIKKDNLLLSSIYGLTLRAKEKPTYKLLSLFNSNVSYTKFEKILELEKNAQNDELKRLLYVAITRAKEEIYIACNEQTFNNKNRSKSLMGLLLKCYDQNEEEFLESVDILKHEIDISICYKNKATIKEEEYISIDIKESRKRIFASLIKAKSDKDFLAFSKDYKNTFDGIDGSLAHELVAKVGSAIFGDLHIENLLLAELRARNDHVDPKVANVSLKASKITLEKLKDYILKAEQVYFEMPLSCLATDNIVIEGFADLVMEFDDFVGLIEFKSSPKLLNEPSTFLQAFAYCLSLRPWFQKPVKWALCLLGSDDEIFFNDFNEQCEKLLIDSLI